MFELKQLQRDGMFDGIEISGLAGPMCQLRDGQALVIAARHARLRTKLERQALLDGVVLGFMHCALTEKPFAVPDEACRARNSSVQGDAVE